MKTLTMNELSQYIGKKVYLYWSGTRYAAKIHFEIADVKTAYGSVRFFVTPIAGDGGIWVNEGSVNFIKE